MTGWLRQPASNPAREENVESTLIREYSGRVAGTLGLVVTAASLAPIGLRVDEQRRCPTGQSHGAIAHGKT